MSATVANMTFSLSSD